MATTTFDSILNHLLDKMGDKSADEKPRRAKRPLKMPKDYDFSTRNVDWSEYKDDYILRTDAVWEKSKLLDLFYTHYKSQFVYDTVNNRYMIANIR